MSQIPRGEWDRHTVAEVMRHDLTALTISPDADALDALSKMQRNGVTCLLVTAGDRLVGMIGLSDLLRFLDLKLDLEGADDSGSGQRVEGEARDTQVERRAARAEAYAAAAIDLAAAAINEAEEAILDAAVARIDADAAQPSATAR